VRKELEGLNGGAKQLRLRQNRGEVEAYFFKHGHEATCREFNLRSLTLERFFARKGYDARAKKLSESDRFVLRIAMEGDRELKRRISRLEEWQVEVQPVIEVGKALIGATMAGIQIQSGKTPLLKDPLQLANFGEKSEKRS
jgi:hypothetical protein